jgi:tetratricopeptide (TPR) repeat protein
MNMNLGSVYYSARRYDEAIQQLRKTAELDFNYTRAHMRLALCYVEKGMAAEALAEARLGGARDGRAETAQRWWVEPYVYARTGEKRRALELIEASPNGRAIDRARVFAALGRKDEAFKLLETALEERGDIIYLRADPVWDPLRGDPRFDDLIRRIGLPKAADGR